MLVVRPATETAIAKNYSFILVGLLFWPLLIAAHFIARRKRRELSGWEQSHYSFQFRTTSIYLCVWVATAVVSLAFMIWRPADPPIEDIHGQMRLIMTINIQLLMMLWPVVRSIRGLYISALGTAIETPNTFWIWPC